MLNLLKINRTTENEFIYLSGIGYFLGVISQQVLGIVNWVDKLSDAVDLSFYMRSCGKTESETFFLGFSF